MALAVGTLALGNASGCMLFGYDLTQTGEHDGGISVIDAATVTFDGAPANPNETGPTASDAANGADAQSTFDASSPLTDAGSDAGDEGGADAGDASSPCTVNACGGCAVLAHAPASVCGVCGVGRYACDGEDAVVCVGGEKLPESGGGDVLIDDFEDGDRYVRGDAELSGDWYTVSDGTAGSIDPPVGTAFLPVSPGAGSSNHAAHVSGSGFTDWGAGLAVSLNAFQCRYDASRQTGLTFAVKGTGRVIVSAATRQTTLVDFGGTCTGSDCNDHFNASVTLSGSWTWYTLPWTSLTQEGWGTAATFSPSELLYVQFWFAENTTFDLYVDDVGFY